ncbi:hypothetical protein BD289DRAFT_431511 [Coniella lustricola]|uniref:C3H1-type domain-containing protein n=1 Tax=Coniella lustricola TaxID=2025994 RepID=A0A2T3AAW9_9PEZI|nr:hypothetical protein BD289DRAFT_431511 [Coniella lustricola]
MEPGFFQKQPPPSTLTTLGISSTNSFPYTETSSRNMSDENQKLMEQISLLAGQINRAKNQQAGVVSIPSPQFSGPSRPYGRGGQFRGHHSYASRGGYRVGKPPAHRHRTLVLGGTSGQSTPASDTASGSENGQTSSWVSKNDRHLQLINTSIYQEQSEARTKAIEQTRLQRLRQKGIRERSQFMSHLRQAGSAAIASTDPASGPAYEITVEGIRFAVARNGSKLIRLPEDPSNPKTTPKQAVVGGVKFYRTKSGNMYRQAIVKAQRRSGAVRKVNVPCKNFSTTGSCPKGPMCRYVHDHSKVSICKDFLQKGACAYGDQCDLSHELTPERTPHCLHYAKGSCSKDDCPYTHRVLPPGASVCHDFGFYGYCDKGISCSERHTFECPDFSNNGVCKNKHCKLPHRERASVLRKADAAREQAATDGEDDNDPSSDDDDADSIGPDEVDSDEVDEFVGEDGSADFEQQDFISL